SRDTGENETCAKAASSRTRKSHPMNFDLTPEQQAIRQAILDLLDPAGPLGDDYWLTRDRDGGFPIEFFDAFARGGWLGIAMPEEYGGSGLGVTEAAIAMQAVAESGAG